VDGFSYEIVHRVNIFTDRLLSTQTNCVGKKRRFVNDKANIICRNLPLCFKWLMKLLLSPSHYHTPITGYHTLLHLSGNRKIIGSDPGCRPGVLTRSL